MNTAVGRLVRAELRLMTRDPLVLTFVFAFPIVTMLIIGGALHPGIQADGASHNIRNGVGVLDKDTAAAANVVSMAALSSGGGTCEAAAGVAGAAGVGAAVFAAPGIAVAVSPFGWPVGVAVSCICAAWAANSG